MKIRSHISRVAHSRKTIVVGVVLFVFGALLTGLGVYWYFVVRDDNGTTATEVGEALEEDLSLSTYSPYEEYSSFEYGFTFDYNTEQYNLSRTATSVELAPKQLVSGAKAFRLNMYDSVADLETFEISRLGDLIDTAANTSGTTEKLSSESINGITTNIYKYSYQAFKRTAVQSVYFFFEKDGVGFELIVSPYDDTAKDAGVEFLRGVTFVDTSALDPNATYSDVSGSYSFTYDRSAWELREGTEKSTALVWKNSGSVTEKAVFEWDAISSGAIADLEVLTDLKEDSLEASAESYVLVDEEDADLGGESAKRLEVRYKSQAWNTTKFLIIFVTYKDDYSYLVTGEFSSAQSDAIEDFEKVIQTFEFVELSQESVSLRPSQPSDCSGLFAACAAGDGTSTSDGAGISQTELITSLNKPAVVRVLNEFCVDVSISYYADASNSTGRELEWCSVGYGSGFFVEGTGYVVTNGHVAVNLPNNSIYEMFANGIYDDYVVDFIIDLAAYDGFSINRAQAQTYFQDDPVAYRQLAAVFVISLVDDNGAEFTASNILSIQYKEDDVILVEDGIQDRTDVLRADLVDYRYDDLDPETLMPKYTGDVALLKTKKAGDYPVVNLGDTGDITEGMGIIVLGFPGVVDYTLSSFAEADYYTLPLTGKPTVTQGVVSSIHENLELVQVDASISEGNSGGPGFSMGGNVIGIVTYKTAESGAADYNYLRVVEEIKELLKANNIDNDGGEVDTLWRSGMDALVNGNYGKAVSDLEDVKDKFPEHKSVSRYLSQAKDLNEKYPSVDENADKVLGLERNTFWILVGCGVVGLGVGGVLVLLTIVAAIRRKKRAKASKPTTTKISSQGKRQS